MIPDEAISAACAAFADQATGDTYSDGMRSALEAAAPHLFAHLLAFAHERDNALGAIRSHITTYELRKLLGVEDAPIVEAATPHVRAAAWDRGNRAALGRPNADAAEQFLFAYAARSGVGREQALNGRVVSTCTCGDEECEGFQLIPEYCVLEWRGETVLIRGAAK